MSKTTLHYPTLSDADFQHVIRCAPLVSIDLIVRNREGKILLGLRRNEPAQGKWFVPGGRIRKDETVEKAFSRIVQSELKISAGIGEARFIGPFEHHYSTNRFELAGVTTQYIVLAYELAVTADLDLTPDDQHSEKKWWIPEQIIESDDVHENTAAYFKVNPVTAVHVGPDSLRSEEQYKVIADRRNSFNTLLWQTPALSLTAQAFLLSIVANQQNQVATRLVCGGVAIVVALSTFQLFAKHQLQERKAARHLAEFERNHKHLGYVSISGRQHSGTDDTWLDPERKKSLEEFDEFVQKLSGFPSTTIWLLLQMFFCLVAFLLIFIALHTSIPTDDGKATTATNMLQTGSAAAMPR